MKKTGNILRTVAISTAIALAFLVVMSVTVSAEYVADLTVLWSSGLSDNVNAVFVADLDNNGQKEVIAGTRDNKVFLLDSNGNTKWSKTVGSAVTQVYAADTDGDGIKEVIAGTDYNDLGKVYAFDTNGNLQWTFQTGAKHYWPDNKLNVRVIIAGDVDNDAKEEVVVGSTHYYWFPSRICVLGENGILEGEYWNPGYMYSIEISDLENDGSNEIIAGFVNNDYGYEGAVAVFDGNNVGGEAPAYANGYDYNAGTQRWYWHSGVDHSSINSIYAFDVGADGDKEIVCGAQDNRVYLLNSNGGVVWTYATAGTVSSVYAADIDADGKGEIIAGSSDKNMYCLEHTKSLKWKYQTGGSARIPFAGDLDNDGASEIVAVSDKVYVLNSAGKLKYSYSGSGKVYVADLGTDGTKEIVLGNGTSVYALSATISDALSPEANLDVLDEIISYQNKISEYVGDNSDEMFELAIIYATPYPLQNKEKKEQLEKELIENIPKLEIEQQELENFYSFLANIKEGEVITFTPDEEGTKVKVGNKPEYLVKGLYISIPYDKITIEKEEFRIIKLTVEEDVKETSTTLKLFYEDFYLFSDLGIEYEYNFNIDSVDGSLNVLLFIEDTGPIVGYSVILITTNDDNAVTITMNDPFPRVVGLGSKREMNGKIAVCVGGSLQAGIGIDVGAEAFASLPLKEADIRGSGKDFVECFEKKVGEDINYVLNPIVRDYVAGSCAYDSTPENTILGVGFGESLGIGPKIEVEDVELGIDGKGSVKASIFAPKNVLDGIKKEEKVKLIEFLANDVQFLYKLYQLKDVKDPLEILVESCLFWTLHEQAKELYKDEDTLKSLSFELEGGIGTDVAISPVGASGQLSVASESDWRTLVVPYTLDPLKFYDFIANDPNFAVALKEAGDVRGGIGISLETGISKDLFEIRVTGTDSKVSGWEPLLISTQESKDIKVGDSFSDYGKDVDGNGLYDYLTVEFPLEVNKSGNYTVTGLLYKNSTCISVAKNSSYLYNSTHKLSLDFEGLHFYASRINGSYCLGYWILGENNLSILNTSSGYNTSFYNYTEFESPKAYLNNYNDSGVDTDGDGLYDYLRVDVEINTSKEQNLIVEGYIEKDGTLVYNSTQADLNPGMTTVFLYFDGKRIKESGLNGSYNLTINIYTLQGIKIDFNEFSTRNYNFTDFQKPNISLTNEYDDMLNDIDSNGLYDYLGIYVGVDVKEPGNYTVDAYLSGNRTFLYAYNHTYLDTGSHNLLLNFDGLKIRQSHVNQSYNLTSLRLFDDNGAIFGIRDRPYVTSMYNYTEFQLPDLRLLREYSDKGVDVNNNGLYDYLLVDVRLDVNKGGYYTVVGYLNCNNSFVYAENTTLLEEGEHFIKLNFDGKSIYEIGANASYHVERVGIIQKGKYMDYMNRTYNTSIYNYTDFEKVNKPPIANFTYSPEKPVINQTIIFNASLSNDPDGNITLYEWDFGDGSNTTGVIVNHSYLNAGNYTVTLKVTDNDGAENTITKEVKVSSIISLPLAKGWNLISVPLNLTTWELGEEAVVGDPLNVTPKNSLTSIYRYNTTSGLFEKCDHFDNWGWWPATGSENFTKLEPGRGYWVMAKNDCNLTFTGTAPSDINVTLNLGWNLVGWYSMEEALLGEESVVGDPLNVTPRNSLTSIYRYNSSSGLFEKCDHFDDWGWWPATGSESFTKLEPGRGYWVMAKNDCVWRHEAIGG